LTPTPVEWAIAAATGNNARVYRLNTGVLERGREADVLVIDACLGGSKNDALSALKNGDIVAVGAVVIDGVPRLVGCSRNTPSPIKQIRVAQCHLPMDFNAAH
jgi:enamidase